jgi:aconitate hydratase
MVEIQRSLDNISNNMLIGAVNAYNMETNRVKMN